MLREIIKSNIVRNPARGERPLAPVETPFDIITIENYQAASETMMGLFDQAGFAEETGRVEQATSLRLRALELQKKIAQWEQRQGNWLT